MALRDEIAARIDAAGFGDDAGAERNTRPPKPCCARLKNDWCALPHGHNGPHMTYTLAKRFAPHLAIARKAIEP